MNGGIFFAFARFMAMSRMMGMVMQETAAKFMAVKAGARLLRDGTHFARPVVWLAISAFSNEPKEPAMINGT